MKKPSPRTHGHVGWLQTLGSRKEKERNLISPPLAGNRQRALENVAARKRQG